MGDAWRIVQRGSCDIAARGAKRSAACAVRRNAHEVYATPRNSVTGARRGAVRNPAEDCVAPTALWIIWGDVDPGLPPWARYVPRLRHWFGGTRSAESI